METKELLILGSRQCAQLVLPMLDDLSTAPHVSPVSGGGNHAHWLVGHILHSDGNFRASMDGTPNPLASLAALFGAGTTPEPEGRGYPPYPELLAELKSRNEATLAWISGLSEQDLGRATQVVPPGFESFFGTWRQVLLMRIFHWMTHRGQLADCRRAAGRAPLLA